MKARLIVALGLVVCAPVSALAAEAEKQTPITADQTTLQESTQTKAKFNEIERGFSFRLPIGVMTYLTPVSSVAGGFSKRYTPGLSIGIELGYDVLPFLDIGAFFSYSHVYGASGGATLNGATVGNTFRDLNTGLGGVMARISFFRTERVYLGVRVGIGYGFQDTGIEKLQHGVGGIGALTLEYFTRIRHFSVALDVGANMFFTPKVSVALNILPAVRYTF